MKTSETSGQRIPTVRIEKPIVEFLTFVSIGSVVFWLTDSLVAGAVLPSIQAGWRSFRTGWWILHSDNRRSRSWICSAFCFATGFWKSAAAALASIGLLVAESHWAGQKPDQAQGIVILQRLFIGILLTAVVGLVASICAALASVRVWVHPLLRDWTRDDFSVIANLAVGNRLNHAMFVLATSLGCPMLVPMYFLLIRPPTPIVLPVVIFGGALLTLVCYGWLASRIVATSLHECWDNLLEEEDEDWNDA